VAANIHLLKPFVGGRYQSAQKQKLEVMDELLFTWIEKYG
jgi:hypothetical protein